MTGKADKARQTRRDKWQRLLESQEAALLMRHIIGLQEWRAEACGARERAHARGRADEEETARGIAELAGEWMADLQSRFDKHLGVTRGYRGRYYRYALGQLHAEGYRAHPFARRTADEWPSAHAAALGAWLASEESRT